MTRRTFLWLASACSALLPTVDHFTVGHRGRLSYTVRDPSGAEWTCDGPEAFRKRLVREQNSIHGGYRLRVCPGF